MALVMCDAVKAMSQEHCSIPYYITAQPSTTFTPYPKAHGSHCKHRHEQTTTRGKHIMLVTSTMLSKEKPLWLKTKELHKAELQGSPGLPTSAGLVCSSCLQA